MQLLLIEFGKRGYRQLSLLDALVKILFDGVRHHSILITIYTIITVEPVGSTYFNNSTWLCSHGFGQLVKLHFLSVFIEETRQAIQLFGLGLQSHIHFLFPIPLFVISIAPNIDSTRNILIAQIGIRISCSPSTIIKYLICQLSLHIKDTSKPQHIQSFILAQQMFSY